MFNEVGACDHDHFMVSFPKVLPYFNHSHYIITHTNNRTCILYNSYALYIYRTLFLSKWPPFANNPISLRKTSQAMVSRHKVWPNYQGSIMCDRLKVPFWSRRTPPALFTACLQHFIIRALASQCALVGYSKLRPLLTDSPSILTTSRFCYLEFCFCAFAARSTITWGSIAQARPHDDYNLPIVEQSTKTSCNMQLIGTVCS